MKCFRLLSAILLLPFFSSAWDGVGHSTCGAIAYYYLKSHNPAVITKVVATLQKHPWYADDKRWAAKLAGLSEEERNVTLFMLASTFPDDARSVPELGGGEHSRWHYVDYPFVPAGSTAVGKEPQTPNAEQKIIELLASTPREEDAVQKAIDVCWIFHLIEDVHQPLHTVSMYDNNHPDGDKGGNATFIKLPERNEPVKLHSYWDGLMKGSKKSAPETAQELLDQIIYKESNLTELTTNMKVSDWILKESFPLAKEQVYENGKINGTSDKPTEVDQSYDDHAKQTGERRVVIAGIRVAKKLSEMFPD